MHKPRRRRNAARHFGGMLLFARAEVRRIRVALLAVNGEIEALQTWAARAAVADAAAGRRPAAPASPMLAQFAMVRMTDLWLELRDVVAARERLREARRPRRKLAPPARPRPFFT